MDPITREEKLMAGEQLEPITRKEYFLAKAAGMDVETPEPITREEMFLSMISGGGTGGSGGGGSIPSVSPKAVNFYDYDGTCLYAYTVEEAQALTEMPPLPEREGLICQGWNWTLEDVKDHNRAVNVGATYTTDDGTTRIYITLQEGRTYPMLGVCPKGTVTVDWGDGTAPDTLTGTSTSTVQWTPNHNYAEPGNYVIRLSVDGEMGFYGYSDSNKYSCILRHGSSADSRNCAYQNSVTKIEIGIGAKAIGSYAFSNCYSLASIIIPNSVTTIGTYAFDKCYFLASITIPDSIALINGRAVRNCYSLASIIIPNSVTTIGSYAFDKCYSLTSVTIPDSVTLINNNAFDGCYSLASITIPDDLLTIESGTFLSCHSLTSIAIPDSVTNIRNTAFSNCCSLASIIIPDSVTDIAYSAFNKCSSVRFYDFSKHTAVPTLSDTNAFNGIPSDCEIRVPAALYDEWIAATNWATYASYIKAV